MVLARRSTGFGKCQSWYWKNLRVECLPAFPVFPSRNTFADAIFEMARICFEHPHQYKHTASPAQVSGCHWHCLAHSQLWISLPQNGLHSITSGGFLASSFQPHRDIRSCIQSNKHLQWQTHPWFFWGDLSRLWHWRGCADAFQEAKTGRSRFRRSHPRPCASGGCATSERFFFALQEGVTQLKWQKPLSKLQIGMIFLPMTVWLCDCMTACVLLRSWNSKASSNCSRRPGNWKEMAGIRCWWNWGWYIHCDRNIFWCQKCNGSVKSCR